MLSIYTTQFLLLAGAHALAVVSPGPDFAIVIKQSISHGRRHAIVTSFGIGSAILVHVLYSVLGIGLIISQSVVLFSLLKYLCAAYLIYIGIGALRAKPAKQDLSVTEEPVVTGQSTLKSFQLGFMTNVLNPKATLFFLSIFSVIVSAETPLAIVFGYGLYLCLATALWFSFVALIFSRQSVRQQFVRMGHHFDHGMGVVLVLLGITVAWSE